jgi:multisubunit Na+/H+ antiporter MnhB subunit
MIETHYAALVVSYGAALAGWLLLHRFLHGLWPAAEPARFAHPWRATGAALLGVVGVLLVGQAYVRGWMLPEVGIVGPIFGAINQIAIFAPILLVLVFRREPASSAWLSRDRLPARMAAGAGLAILALGVYTLVRAEADTLPTVLSRVVSYGHLDEAVQVFLEDITIAILFVRLAAAIGPAKATGLVALLFAAGHIPAMLAGGADAAQLALLARDMLLGVALITVLQRSRDIVWFWFVHFAMDMSQFRAVIFGP